MFHHFHNNREFIATQGSISAEDWYEKAIYSEKARSHQYYQENEEDWELSWQKDMKLKSMHIQVFINRKNVN